MTAPAAPGRAFATVVYGDGAHACEAAVLGAVLRRLEPDTQRLALTHDVSEETRAILAVGEIWQIRNASTPPTYLPYQPLQQSSWHRQSPASRKVDLWALPFEAVMFWDVDHVPTLGHGVQTQQLRKLRLQQLWQLLDNGTTTVARAESPGCFNSGLMVLRPDRAQHAALLHHLKQPPDAADLRRCSKGADQPLLNLVFQKWRNYCPARAKNGPCVWGDMLSLMMRGELNGSLACPGPLYHQADSWHFFDATATGPWHFGIGCGSEAGAGGGAMLGRNGTQRPPCSSHARVRLPRCHTLASLHTRWWDRFRELPTSTQQRCTRRLAAVTPRSGSSRSPGRV